MKIVKNCCYGGFGLSRLAVMEYLKLISKDCFFYEWNDGIYKKSSVSGSGMVFHVVTKDYGDIATESDMSIEDNYFTERDMERNDANLIAVIEKLGDAANGYCSELEIVDIPDDVDWQISEYDGWETIEEKHRSW